MVKYQNRGKLSHALEMRGRTRYETSADIRREDALIVIELAEKMIKILEERIEKMRIRLRHSINK